MALRHQSYQCYSDVLVFGFVISASTFLGSFGVAKSNK